MSGTVPILRISDRYCHKLLLIGVVCSEPFGNHLAESRHQTFLDLLPGVLAEAPLQTDRQIHQGRELSRMDLLMHDACCLGILILTATELLFGQDSVVAETIAHLTCSVKLTIMNVFVRRFRSNALRRYSL